LQLGKVSHLGFDSMNRIKKVLKEQGRTQTWLAEKIGKSYAVVTNYCNNNSQPSIQVLTEISQILDVDVREFSIIGFN
jgi:putative transcriptional regulator